jgi:hypothetical protein
MCKGEAASGDHDADVEQAVVDSEGIVSAKLA